MSKLMILLTVSVAFIIGCKRVAGLDQPVTEEDVSAGTNALAIAGYAWPILTPFVRFIPIVGPILQPILSNISWAALATRQQKEADK